jgi:hypothetical protein
MSLTQDADFIVSGSDNGWVFIWPSSPEDTEVRSYYETIENGPTSIDSFIKKGAEYTVHKRFIDFTLAKYYSFRG